MTRFIDTFCNFFKFVSAKVKRETQNDGAWEKKFNIVDYNYIHKFNFFLVCPSPLYLSMLVVLVSRF